MTSQALCDVHCDKQCLYCAATASGAWNPAFAKLLQPAAKKQRVDPAQGSSLPLNGMQ